MNSRSNSTLSLIAGCAVLAGLTGCESTGSGGGGGMSVSAGYYGGYYGGYGYDDVDVVVNRPDGDADRPNGGSDGPDRATTLPSEPSASDARPASTASASRPATRSMPRRR
jgi:hypothetical protein